MSIGQKERVSPHNIKFRGTLLWHIRDKTSLELTIHLCDITIDKSKCLKYVYT